MFTHYTPSTCWINPFIDPLLLLWIVTNKRYAGWRQHGAMERLLLSHLRWKAWFPTCMTQSPFLSLLPHLSESRFYLSSHSTRNLRVISPQWQWERMLTGIIFFVFCDNRTINISLILHKFDYNIFKTNNVTPISVQIAELLSSTYTEFWHCYGYSQILPKPCGNLSHPSVLYSWTLYMVLLLHFVQPMYAAYVCVHMCACMCVCMYVW